MKNKIDKLIANNFTIMLYVDDGKTYWLPNHFRHLARKDMLKDKVLLGANTMNLPNGFNYITHSFNTGKVSRLIEAEALKLKTKTMAKLTGKEALQQIAAQFKLMKDSAKLHAKNVSLFNKLVDKFPKAEKEAFAEKLTKYTTPAE